MCVLMDLILFLFISNDGLTFYFRFKKTVLLSMARRDTLVHRSFHVAENCNYFIPLLTSDISLLVQDDSMLDNTFSDFGSLVTGD